MNRKSVIALVLAVLALGGLGYSAWRYVAERDSQTCGACSRVVHEHTKTVALIDGKRRVYCCPACALSEHRQEGKPVEVVELTDYLGSGPIKPKDAIIVRNSDVNPCLAHGPSLGPDKQPMQSVYDRCIPSMLAFRDMKSAQRFSSEHGGQVLTFTALASEYRR